MAETKSELLIITKSKDLASYVLAVTQNSPKHFRFTFVSRMQNLVLDIIENLYRANDTLFRRGDQESFRVRQEYQHKAMTDIRLLAYIAQLAMEQKCILPKQFEQISIGTTDCLRILGAWISSDRRRMGL